jgi:septum formation protein
MDAQMTVYLASRSPRRAHLLEQIGVSYRTVEVDVDEGARPGEPGWALVGRLARAKALTALRELPEPAYVIGADTVVIVDGDVLGKPSGRDEALGQLERLSGRAHEVLTAVALARRGSAGTVAPVRLSRSRVWFRVLGEAERVAYWDTGEPADKAGSYGIQGRAGEFVTRLEGSYSAVVGLPLFETCDLLRGAGLAAGGSRQSRW